MAAGSSPTIGSPAADLRHLDRFPVRFGAMATLFALAHWPALTEAWWYLDDYARVLELEPPFVRACQNGRPLEALWMMTLAVDCRAEMFGANIALRGMQALIHVAVAVLAGGWLAAVLRQRAAFWFAALFLLWPFHAEAVLWRTAGSYPLAALLGTISVLLAWPATGTGSGARTTAAAALLAASTLMNQTASLIAWVLPAIATLAGASRSWQPTRVLSLLLVHLGSAATSYLITCMPEYATPRAALTVDPVAKLRLLRSVLSRLWFWRDYPAALRFGHNGLLLAAVLAVPWPAVRWRSATTHAIRLLLVGALPFATILAVRESHVPYRVMYLGPWLLVGACLLGWRRTASGRAWQGRSQRVITVAASLLSIGAYLYTGNASSREYVALFAAEQRVLAAAERLAIEHGTDRVHVEQATATTEYNPLRFEFMHGDSKVSAFQVPWAARGRVERFSGLQLVQDPQAADAATRVGPSARRSDRFEVVFDAVTRTVLILQPR